jgi:hypothetical protein
VVAVKTPETVPVAAGIAALVIVVPPILKFAFGPFDASPAVQAAQETFPEVSTV